MSARSIENNNLSNEGLDQVNTSRLSSPEAPDTTEQELDRLFQESSANLDKVETTSIFRNPILRRALSPLLAAVVLFGAQRVAAKESSSSGSEVQTAHKEIIIKPSELANVDSGPEKFDISEEIAESVKERGSDLISLEDIKENVFNRRFLKSAQEFVAMNKDRRIRGEERHQILEEYLENAFQQIAEAKRDGKVSGGQVRQLEMILQATVFDDNELVCAGTPEDIIRAARKSGMVSPESTKKVMKKLFDEGHSFQVDLGKSTVTLDNGEIRKISDRAIMLQLIGNAPLEMPVSMNQGVVLEGTYDVEKIDPNKASDIKRDAELITDLVNAYWPEISKRLTEQGVDVEKSGEEIKQQIIDSLTVGTERTFGVETANGQFLGVDQGDLDRIGMVSELQSGLKEYFSELGLTPAISLESTETQKINEAMATVSGNLELTGMRISDEQLCRGNFVIVVQIGEIKIILDQDMQTDIDTHGIGIFFDRLEAVLPSLGGPDQEGFVTPTPAKTGLTEVEKDTQYKTIPLKEKPRVIKTTQHALGVDVHKGGVGRGSSERNPRGQSGKRGGRNYRGGQTRSQRHTGKS